MDVLLIIFLMITSLQNTKIKEIVKLRKASKRKKSDLIVIEGKKEISLAMEAGVRVREVYCNKDESLLPPPLLFGGQVTERGQLYFVSPEVFQKISMRENPDGFLALAEPRNLTIADIELPKNPLVVILESVEKPGNLGAILRTCDAAGVDALIINDARTDIYNPNVIRASLGAVFTKQVVVADFESTQEWLKASGIKSFAATPSTELEHFEADFSGPSAIVIGTEHEGLSDRWLEAADFKVKIPMQGRIDSLNASVSAAVIVYEAVRGRVFRGPTPQA